MRIRSFFTYKFCFLILLNLIACLSLFSQNPLEIKSRLGESELQIHTPNVPLSNNKDSGFQTDNPLDVKKEPKNQKTKLTTPKETKRNVNEKSSTLSRPAKIVILLLSVMFFVLIRNINLKGFKQIFQSLLSNIKLVEYKNSINSLFNVQIGLFYLFFFLNLAYFIYLTAIKQDITLPNFRVGPFLTLIIILVGIYLVKHLVLMIIEFALSIRRAIGHHLFSISIHNIVLGFLLFFINAFYAFSSPPLDDVLMYLGVGLILIMYIVRQVKGLQYLSVMREFRIFHFFIYLCGCEISPLLLGAKFITG